MAALVDEADDRRVAGHVAVDRLARLEARVVDRRHELLREERAHGLPDEVGRRDARDPEAVRDLGGERRLPGACGAADQDDDRHVEPLQVGEALQPADRPLPLLLAEGLLGASTPSRFGSTVGTLRSARSTSIAPRELVGAVRGDAHRDQRPRHHALRVREVGVPERQRLALAALRHQATRSGTSARRASSRPSATTSFAASTMRLPCDQRVLGDDVDRRRLQLDEVRVGLYGRELALERSAIGEPRGDVHDVRLQVIDDRRTGGENGDPPFERSSGPEPQLGADRVRCVTADRHDHVGDQAAIGVEIAVCLGTRADDEHAPVDVHRRDRRAAAVEDDHVGRPLGGEPRARRDVRGEDGAAEPAARAAAADRRHPAERRHLQVIRRRMPARLSRARAARRRSAASRSPRALPGRHGPSRPRRRRGRCASRRARCAVTAVLPTRLPVPITAIDGSSNGSKTGGSNLKSAPT